MGRIGGRVGKFRLEGPETNGAAAAIRPTIRRTTDRGARASRYSWVPETRLDIMGIYCTDGGLTGVLIWTLIVDESTSISDGQRYEFQCGDQKLFQVKFYLHFRFPTLLCYLLPNLTVHNPLEQWFLTLLEVRNPTSSIHAFIEPFGGAKIKYVVNFIFIAPNLLLPNPSN